jgi:cell division ATPase FtsA
VARPEYLLDLVGVIDVGGHTTNVLTAIGGREQVRATTSIPSGAWDVIRDIQGQLSTLCAGLDLSGHQLAKAVEEGKVNYFGQDVDLTGLIAGSAKSLARRVISSASQLWGSGAELHHVLITGGGAHLIGPAVVEHFTRHQSVIILEEPVFANAVGYHRFGKYLEEKGAW